MRRQTPTKKEYSVYGCRVQPEVRKHAPSNKKYSLKRWMEISNKQSCTPVKAKPLRGGWVCVLARMCRLRKSRDINYEKAGWISFSPVLTDVVVKSLSAKCCDRALRACSKGSVWSHKENPDYDCRNIAFRIPSKVRENVSREEYTLSVTTFEGRGSTAAIRKETTRLSRLFKLLI